MKTIFQKCILSMQTTTFTHLTFLFFFFFLPKSFKHLGWLNFFYFFFPLSPTREGHISGSDRERSSEAGENKKVMHGDGVNIVRERETERMKGETDRGKIPLMC